VEELVEDEEEHDYESLPVGHGWAVNMTAGAMVSLERCGVRCAVASGDRSGDDRWTGGSVLVPRDTCVATTRVGCHSSTSTDMRFVGWDLRTRSDLPHRLDQGEHGSIATSRARKDADMETRIGVGLESHSRLPSPLSLPSHLLFTCVPSIPFTP
jgi:hypothetical protein